MLGGNIYTMKTMELWNLVCGFGLWLFIYVFKFQVNIFFVIQEKTIQDTMGKVIPL